MANKPKKILKATPTPEFYNLLQEVYEIFNKKLFEKKLSNCMITMQREKSTMGYFSEDRWVDAKGNKTHEIALNPAYFASYPLIEIFQTLVHEMCHLWQHEYGNPSRRTYHNTEWANKMKSIGLMPSSTGRPGGAKTGQKMGDYPDEGGKFEAICKELAASDLFVKWIDRYPKYKDSYGYVPVDLETSEDEVEQVLYTVVSEVIPEIVPIEEIKEAAKVKQKTKYICSGCTSAVWGKPELSIKCNMCNTDFKEIV